MDINKEKYKNAILFFSERVSHIGKTKLNKLLYFMDFDHYEKYGKSITGDTYTNNDLGPVPSHVDEILDEMIGEKLVEISIEPVIDYIRYRLAPLVRYKPDLFKADEVEMLCGVVDKWANHTARELVIASHGEAPWIATRKGEEIPYALAYYRGKFDEPSYDEELRDDKLLISLGTQDS